MCCQVVRNGTNNINYQQCVELIVDGVELIAVVAIIVKDIAALQLQ